MSTQRHRLDRFTWEQRCARALDLRDRCADVRAFLSSTTWAKTPGLILTNFERAIEQEIGVRRILTPTARLVLGCLLSCMTRRYAGFWVPHEVLAATVGRSVRAVFDAMRLLNKLGLVVKVQIYEPNEERRRSRHDGKLLARCQRPNAYTLGPAGAELLGPLTRVWAEEELRETLDHLTRQNLPCDDQSKGSKKIRLACAQLRQSLATTSLECLHKHRAQIARRRKLLTRVPEQTGPEALRAQCQAAHMRAQENLRDFLESRAARASSARATEALERVRANPRLARPDLLRFAEELSDS